MTWRHLELCNLFQGPEYTKQAYASRVRRQQQFRASPVAPLGTLTLNEEMHVPGARVCEQRAKMSGDGTDFGGRETDNHDCVWQAVIKSRLQQYGGI